jgi:hypothetical protein
VIEDGPSPFKYSLRLFVKTSDKTEIMMMRAMKDPNLCRLNEKLRDFSLIETSILNDSL